jgi:hypothetical protein
MWDLALGFMGMPDGSESLLHILRIAKCPSSKIRAVPKNAFV